MKYIYRLRSYQIGLFLNPIKGREKEARRAVRKSVMAIAKHSARVIH